MQWTGDQGDVRTSLIDRRESEPIRTISDKCEAAGIESSDEYGALALERKCNHLDEGSITLTGGKDRLGNPNPCPASSIEPAKVTPSEPICWIFMHPLSLPGKVTPASLLLWTNLTLCVSPTSGP